MNTAQYFMLVCVIICIVLQPSERLASEEPLRWERLPDLPVKLGVAGPLTGVIENRLIVAGGANFPNGMPWEGGKKVWHTEVYQLREPAGNWELLGQLPHALGYGVAVNWKQRMFVVGGSDRDRHYAEGYELSIRNEQLQVDTLPPLPIPLANMGGAMLHDELFIVGGSQEPGEKSASQRMFSMNLANAPRAWRELDALPGAARLLPSIAVLGDHLYIAGGAALERTGETIKRKYLRDAWVYSTRLGWQALADMPEPRVAAPCLALPAGELLIVGGDAGTHVGFQPPEKHPGFSNSVLKYDIANNSWSEFAVTPAPRVTTSAIHWQNRWVIPSGESRPGVRSPEVWSFTLQPERNRP